MSAPTTVSIDAAHRARLYNLLAAAFGDPPTTALLSALGHICPEALEMSLIDLHRAYTRHLVGPGPAYVPPYASAYLSDPRQGGWTLWGEPARAVERWYHRAGLLIAPGHPRVPDHAALELQFMQHLCDRETGALARGAHQTARAWRAIQHAFLRHHLWVWFPQFCQRLQQPTVHRFYRCLAQLALALLEADLSDPQLASQNPPATTEAERQGGAS